MDVVSSDVTTLVARLDLIWLSVSDWILRVLLAIGFQRPREKQARKLRYHVK